MAFSCTRAQSKDENPKEIEINKMLKSTRSTGDIQLNNFNLNDQDLQFIIKKLKKIRFHSLSLANNHLTSNGIEILLNFLRKNIDLTHLILSSNPLGDSSISSICIFVERSTNLNQLSLCDINLTDEGVKQLCQTLKSNSIHLRSIDLRSNVLITDESLEDLFQMTESNSNISACRLDNSGLSNEGKDKLKQVKSVKW